MYDFFMCGRFALGTPKVRLEECFSVSLPDDHFPRYNIAPGSEVLIFGAPEGEVIPLHLQWGLIPHWAKDASIGFSLINARSESVFDKPAFQDAVRIGRCLVPAQAFYEWKMVDGRKQPYAITLNDTDVFAMAGIASTWEDHVSGEIVDSFSILTCAPNTLMTDIHDRMPVILSHEDWAEWLDPSVDQQEVLEPLLVSYPATAMHAWPVGDAVSKVVNDSPNLLERVDVMRQGWLF